MQARRPSVVAFVVLTLLAIGASSAVAQTITVPVLSNVGSGLQSSTFSATLSTSQHGGKTVHVESDNPSTVLVSPNTTTAGAASFDVFIPNGTSAVSFVVQGIESVTGTATVTVSAPGFTSGSRTATIVQPAFDVINLLTTIDTLDPVDPFQVRVGLPSVGNASVNPSQSVRVGGTGFTATITNSNAVAGELITTATTGQTVTVSITPGNMTSPASVAAGGVSFDGLAVGSTTVSAAISGFIATTAASIDVNVTQPTITVGAIPNVGSGLQGSPHSVSLSASQHGGVTVHIESADPLVALVSPNGTTAGSASIDVFLANGITGTSFVVSGMEGIEGASLISVSAPAFTGASQLASIQEPGLDVIGLGTPIDTLDPADPFQVRIGLPGGSGVSPSQPIRVGGVAITATIVHSAATVADLITSALTADTVTVTITPGNALSPSSVAAGGVAFDGTSVGSTTVAATIPGYVTTANATRVVSVTQPVITWSPFGPVGSGLQSSGFTATLAASQHGGVTVHVESVSPSVALVAPNATTAGAASFDQFISNGNQTVTVVISGVENVTGTSVISISASGFVPSDQSVNIVTPALDMIGLPVTLDTLDPNDPFQVRVGVSAGSSVNPVQSIRVGGVPVTATIVHSSAAVADFVTTPLTADTVAVSIQPGNSVSPSTVPTGGVALDGIAEGSTTISASIPGFIATTNASRVVTVTQPSLVLGAFSPVGAGLQSNAVTITLSVTQHGGVTLHVASTNPSVALVAPNASTLGTASFDVFIPNLSTASSVIVAGLENVTGASDIVVSAPGFTSASAPVTIVQPAVNIVGLPSTVDAADPDDPFQARVGLPNPGNATINPLQNVRIGSPGVIATITHTNPNAGHLETLLATGDTVTVAIPAGANTSAINVAGGGVAFDPLAPGTTLVTAHIPGFMPVGDTTQQVTVTQRIITMATIEDVGAGLQTTSVGATLGLAAHGGVSVHVESNTPSIALVSPTFSVPGTVSIDIPLPNGSTQVSFYVHGVATGSTTITASVPTFTSGASGVDVVQPALAVALLADTLLDNAANDPFVIQVGIPTGDNSGLATAQFVRAGSAPLATTISSSDPGIAALVTDTQNGSPVTITIPAGQTQSAASASLGGVDLDPLLAGATTVSASIPGFIATSTASKLVTVKSHLPPTGVTPLPATFALGQNVPNPFNPVTTMHYDVPAGGADVNISVFDVAGRRVRELMNDRRPAGSWSVQWNGRDDRGAVVVSGVYFYRMRAGDFVDTKKMVLLK